MKIEYICHACLSIDTGDLRILTDPWFRGLAYCGQWNVFPKPVNLHAVADTQVLLLSHGHEDHFHSRSLEMVPKTARVLYPYTWYGGVTHYLKELGFEDVAEDATHKTFRLTPHTAVTYLVNSLDSIMVIESHDKVFVNVNDALHAYPTPIIDVFTAYIRHRWPRIDTVFCGFGGASYFPNTVHCDGKNDLEIAEAREQMFVHAFSRIVHRLKPAVAVPFAADFALLRPRQRWINEARFPRARIAEYYRIVYGDSPGNPQIHAMYPGDVLFDNALQPTSPYRQQLHSGNLLHLIDKQYAEEIAALETQACISEFEIEDLERALLRNLLLRARLFSPE